MEILLGFPKVTLFFLVMVNDLRCETPLYKYVDAVRLQKLLERPSWDHLTYSVKLTR